VNGSASFYVVGQNNFFRIREPMRKLPSIAHSANMVLGLLLCNCLFFAFATSAAAASKPIRIVVFGDSLVAGFQLKANDAFPAQLERALKARGHAVEVINAGVSGDTTAGGLERLGWSVPDKTDAVILELGANDMLRGLDPARAKSNLDRIITSLKDRGIEVMLVGMFAARNLGPQYEQAFNAIFPELATKHKLILYPFFLDGIALNAQFNLSDGIHPNGKGVAEITKRILPSVEELIGRVRTKQAAAAKD
jgi:acyl-CoA thioesterase-1